MGSGKHPMADVIYERVRKALPHISLSTVYRNLEIMTQAGLIRKLHLGGARGSMTAGRIGTTTFGASSVRESATFLPSRSAIWNLPRGWAVTLKYSTINWNLRGFAQSA